jgi:hypothetical protein
LLDEQVVSPSVQRGLLDEQAVSRVAVGGSPDEQAAPHVMDCRSLVERRDVAAMVIATRVDPFASDRGRSGSSDGPSASHWDEDRSRGEPYGLGDAQGPA